MYHLILFYDTKYKIKWNCFLHAIVMFFYGGSEKYFYNFNACTYFLLNNYVGTISSYASTYLIGPDHVQMS